MHDRISIVQHPAIQTYNTCDQHHSINRPRTHTHLKCPKYGESNDIPFVILEFFVTSDFHNAIE